jgi:glycopeptide antibiotics resistance protein
MEKKTLTKRIISGVLYFAGIAFAMYIGSIIIKEKSSLDVSGLIIGMLGVCIPIAIATFLLISSISKIENRFKLMKIFLVLISVFYILLLVTALFRNGFRQFEAINPIRIKEYLKFNVNIFPFKTIGGYIQFFIDDSMNKSIIIENLLGNIILFAPMGMLLPCIFQKQRKFKIFLITMLVILISVEIGQVLTRSGSGDVDDVILNLIGAISVYGLWSINSIKNLLNKFYILGEKSE